MSKYMVKVLCLLLLVVSIAMLFLPCWEYESDEGIESASVAEYILYPDEYRTLTRELRDTMDSKKLTTRMALPLFVLLLGGVVLSIASLLLFKSSFPGYSCLVLGTAGIYVYLSNIIVKVGNLWFVHLCFYVVMLIAGILQILLSYKAKKADEAK